MLHNILGFGGRMGRLEYFLARLGLGILVGLLTLALVFGFMPHLGHGERGPVPIGLAVILLAVVLPIYLWFALAFQAKRLRDMGWNPVYFIPGSIMLFVTLQYAARTVPSLVMVSALLNLAQCLCLWFWPSAPTGDGDWYSGPYHERSPGPEPVMDRTPASSSRYRADASTSTGIYACALGVRTPGAVSAAAILANLKSSSRARCGLAASVAGLRQAEELRFRDRVHR